MIEIYQRLGMDSVEHAKHKIILDHAQRSKGRLRTHTTEGEEVRIFLDRGKPLLVGEKLRGNCGKTIQVEGAEEAIIRATCDDWLTFARACYHLGNRHVAMEIGDRSLAIAPDHVLQSLLGRLGLKTQSELALFVPESGAYNHGHDH